MLINGKAHAEYLRTNFKVESENKPKLIVVQVGDDFASNKYIRNKVNAGKKWGVEVEVRKYEENITLDEFCCNLMDIQHEKPDGMIVQLPIPKHLKESMVLLDKIFSRNPMMDVDGFSPHNKAHIGSRDVAHQVPPTAQGVDDLIGTLMDGTDGLVCLIIGRSDIVGKPLANLMRNRNMTVIQAHSKTEFSKELKEMPNIVISATGVPHLFKTSEFPNTSLFIDVGTNYLDGKMVGDILDDANICNVDMVQTEDGLIDSRLITPVPGGVGPLTVAHLMINTIKSWKAK